MSCEEVRQHWKTPFQLFEYCHAHDKAFKCDVLVGSSHFFLVKSSFEVRFLGRFEKSEATIKLRKLQRSQEYRVPWDLRTLIRDLLEDFQPLQFYWRRLTKKIVLSVWLNEHKASFQ